MLIKVTGSQWVDGSGWSYTEDLDSMEINSMDEVKEALDCTLPSLPRITRRQRAEIISSGFMPRKTMGRRNLWQNSGCRMLNKEESQ